MDILERFAPLMAEALHCADTPEGQALPLEEIQARLLHLAKEETLQALPSNQEPEALRTALDDCRFAVSAWVDEQLLTSSRPDAAGWLPLSLQCRFFATTDAGQLFFERLDSILEALGLPAEEDGEAQSLESRLERATALPPDAPGLGTLQVYALCLLYGFSGRLYDQPEVLARLRPLCLNLLHRYQRQTRNLGRLTRNRRGNILFRSLEPLILWILTPLLVCVLFSLFCAAILASTPVRGL